MTNEQIERMADLKLQPIIAELRERTEADMARVSRSLRAEGAGEDHIADVVAKFADSNLAAVAKLRREFIEFVRSMTNGQT